MYTKQEVIDAFDHASQVLEGYESNKQYKSYVKKFEMYRKQINSWFSLLTTSEPTDYILEDGMNTSINIVDTLENLIPDAIVTSGSATNITKVSAEACIIPGLDSTSCFVVLAGAAILLAVFFASRK
jgi:hypothetical protein